MRTRRYILFLIVAVLTFLIGLAAGSIFNFSSGNEVKRKRCGHSQISIAPLPPPPPQALPAAPAARVETERAGEGRTAEAGEARKVVTETSKPAVKETRRGS